METVKYRLKDILKIGNGKDHSLLNDGIYPVFGSGGFMRYVDQYLYEGESVLLPRKGTLNNIQYVNGAFWTVDTCYYTIIDTEIVNPYYLYVLLNSLDLSGLDSGASIPSMTAKCYYNIKINLPDLSTQKRIADILSAYDNLIENNNKRIALLEKAAQELYKEWFVRFRFPGHEKVKFVNGLPEGWELKKIGDICKIKSGYAFKSEWWTDEGVPVIKIKDIQNNTIDLTDLSMVSTENAKKANQFKTVHRDLLIAMTGATIGKLALVPKTDNVMLVNQRVGKFFFDSGKKQTENVGYIYFTMQQKWIQELILMISGSNAAQPNISPFDLEKIKIAYNGPIIEKYNCLVSNYIDMILKLQEENQNLTKQRDLLLPRLMSDKLEV